jgi:hypothetical protein
MLFSYLSYTLPEPPNDTALAEKKHGLSPSFYPVTE